MGGVKGSPDVEALRTRIEGLEAKIHELEAKKARGG
jgi:BMFP domain-containing protein YqiC